MVINGVLAGLVAITAGCNVVGHGSCDHHWIDRWNPGGVNSSICRPRRIDDPVGQLLCTVAMDCSAHWQSAYLPSEKGLFLVVDQLSS